MTLVVLLLTELGVRLVAHRLPEPLEWYANKAQRVVAEMDRWNDAQLTADVVFVGTSMVGHAINIGSFEAANPDVDLAANAAIPAAQTPVIKRWLLEEVLPRVKPEHVVWGISSLDFNGNRPSPTIDSYNDARATKLGAGAAADRILSSVLYLAKYRAELRDPEVIASLFEKPRERRTKPLEDLLSAVPSDQPNKTKKELRRVRRAVLGEWELGQSEVEAFVQTLEELKRQAIRVTIVLMPVSTQYVRAHPNGKTDYHEFRRAIEVLVGELDIELINAGRQFDDSSFKDYTHLWNSEAHEFSVDLARRLAASGHASQ